MADIRIYAEDLQIARALIQRDEDVTRQYFYQQCYPLFKSVFDHYYTDCSSCKEFIDEIYVLVMAPSRLNGRCQLESFRGGEHADFLAQNRKRALLLRKV